MDLATGAMGSLLKKLTKLAMDEYRLQKGVPKRVESLSKELEGIEVALQKVGQVLPEQLDPQVKLWAREIKELSYDMEDVVDMFLVHVEGCQPSAKNDRFKALMNKMSGLFKKGKKRHQIADAIDKINAQIRAVTDRRGKYTVDSIVPTDVDTTPVDPRLRALYTEVTELVGISGTRDQELIDLLSVGEEKKLKTVSVVEFGGLGKTTLVRLVYDKLISIKHFDCWAFVSVGRKTTLKKVLRDIVLNLNKYEPHVNLLDEWQLADRLQEILQDKKYLVVIDDIWDETMWKNIKCAFPDKKNGSRIITTTRVLSVSKACCSSDARSIYEMEPLSYDDSKRLFYIRVSSDSPHEFEEDILRKCGRIPLAIITIASILATGQHEWPILAKSIGRGLIEDASVEEMHKVLSLSYYDLPTHLKTCLLYLSIFPEDSEIERDQLIWRWIAEDFVQCKNINASLQDIGESYFNELINRGLIHPVYNKKGMIEGCRVHDMILDLICSLSSEESFVTIFDGIMASEPSESKVRRLSLQNRKEDFHQKRKEDDQTTPLDSMDISHVRSVTVFEPAIGQKLSFSSFIVLRVLVLSGCYIGGNSLSDIEHLFHLRYLGLADTHICELPAKIEKLQFLQVLDVRYNRNLKELPSGVYKLGRLMCLQVDQTMRLEDGLGNLASIQVLKEIRGASLNIVEELGKLAKLRELKIYFEYNMSLEVEKAFVKSLSNLQNIEILTISGSFQSMDLLGLSLVHHRKLRMFESVKIGKFSSLPAWIKTTSPSPLSSLSELHIGVEVLQQNDLQILGRLRALHSFRIKSTHQAEKLLIDGFHCTRDFFLFCLFPLPVIFQRGALPVAEKVQINFGMLMKEDRGDVSFDAGLTNLSSLQEINAAIYCHGITVGEAKKTEAKLRQALNDHHNRPRYKIDIQPPIPEDGDAEDEDIME